MINSTILNRLQDESVKSFNNHKHSAVIIYKGRPVAYGFNYLNGKTSCHAECSAIRRFLADRGFTGWLTKKWHVL